MGGVKVFLNTFEIGNAFGGADLDLFCIESHGTFVELDIKGGQVIVVMLEGVILQIEFDKSFFGR